MQKGMGFKKVLIANRGEIALRIMRTLRDMGIEAAIIYGKEDRLSLPVQLADDATFRDVINPLDAYLDIEAVVQAAKDMGCDAVHPGYGFLAENAGFVQRLEEEGTPKEAYQFYIDTRSYGGVPHGGFGLGVDRVCSWLSGADHIREVIPFPRDSRRVTP